MGLLSNAQRNAVSQASGPISDLKAAIFALDDLIQTGTSAALSGSGTVTVTARLTANSKIFLTRNTSGGTIGDLKVADADIVVGPAGTFIIRSASASDTSTVNYLIVG